MDSHGRQCPEETKQREEVVSISSTEYRFSNLSKTFSLFSRRYQYQNYGKNFCCTFFEKGIFNEQVEKKKRPQYISIL